MGDEDECARVFKRFDVNGDGKISLSEFAEALKLLGLTSQEEVERRMEEIDTDGDGSITLEDLSLQNHSLTPSIGTLASTTHAFSTLALPLEPYLRYASFSRLRCQIQGFLSQIRVETNGTVVVRVARDAKEGDEYGGLRGVLLVEEHILRHAENILEENERY
ncbi:hypothetical protein V8G54_003873 [Vigna mungo]|uniref:EF-hand domain-containing protein n=1 Tax=Vigna mungo TaxID=3915 RepID=A0AAQ3SAJ1_VIGMU